MRPARYERLAYAEMREQLKRVPRIFACDDIRRFERFECAEREVNAISENNVPKIGLYFSRKILSAARYSSNDIMPSESIFLAMCMVVW